MRATYAQLARIGGFLVIKWWRSGGLQRMTNCHIFVRMLVKLGGLVSEIAGSIGGMTFQRGPNGTVARSKPLPVRRTSTYSTNTRSTLKDVNYQWSQLSQVQRDLWTVFAGTVSWFNRFGDPVTGSGYMAFLKCNLHSYSSLSDFHDFGLFTDPPVSTISALPANPSVSFNTGTFEMLLNSTDSNVDADTDLLLFASPPTSQGRQTWHGPIPFMFHLGASKSLPSAFETPYNDLFPGGLNPAAKQICFVRIQAINTHYGWPGMSTTLRTVFV